MIQQKFTLDTPQEELPVWVKHPPGSKEEYTGYELLYGEIVFRGMEVCETIHNYNHGGYLTSLWSQTVWFCPKKRGATGRQYEVLLSGGCCFSETQKGFQALKSLTEEFEYFVLEHDQGKHDNKKDTPWCVVKK